MSKPVKTTSKVELRLLEPADAHTSYAWRNDEDVWRYTVSKPSKKITVEDEATWIQNVMKDPLSRRFAIIVHGTYVGNMYLTNISKKTAEFHIFIGDKNFWGKGIATIATKLGIEYAKDVLKLQSLYLVVHRENKPAYAIYNKLGFVPSDETGDFVKMALNLASYEK